MEAVELKPITEIIASMAARANHLHRELEGVDEKRAELGRLLTAIAALQDAMEESAPKPRRPRADKGTPRKRAALGKGMPPEKLAPEAIMLQACYAGPDGECVIGAPDFKVDEDVAKAVPPDWCDRNGAEVSNKVCARMQRDGDHLCPPDCARKTKSTG